MTHLKAWAQRHPVIAFVVLCYALTWPAWFLVPVAAGSDWLLMKILLGFGFGPALAAVVLDRLNGTGASIGAPAWWRRFVPVALVVLAVHLWGLAAGDALETQHLDGIEPAGITPIGALWSFAAACVAGFIFATVAGSRSPRLNSVCAWRSHTGWLLVGVCLPAALFGTGLVIAKMQNMPVPTLVPPGTDNVSWALYVLRATLATLLIVAIGEEAGWRGWMLPELQRRFSPLLSAAIVGVVWGLWHFPLFVIGFYADPPHMVFAKAGACVFLSIIFTWLYNRSGGVLLSAVLLHTAFNNTPRVIPATEGAGVPLMLTVVAAMVMSRMWRRLPSNT